MKQERFDAWVKNIFGENPGEAVREVLFVGFVAIPLLTLAEAVDKVSKWLRPKD